MVDGAWRQCLAWGRLAPASPVCRTRRRRIRGSICSSKTHTSSRRAFGPRRASPILDGARVRSGALGGIRSTGPLFHTSFARVPPSALQRRSGRRLRTPVVAAQRFLGLPARGRLLHVEERPRRYREGRPFRRSNRGGARRVRCSRRAAVRAALELGDAVRLVERQGISATIHDDVGVDDRELAAPAVAALLSRACPATHPFGARGVEAPGARCWRKHRIRAPRAPKGTSRRAPARAAPNCAEERVAAELAHLVHPARRGLQLHRADRRRPPAPPRDRNRARPGGDARCAQHARHRIAADVAPESLGARRFAPITSPGIAFGRWWYPLLA